MPKRVRSKGRYGKSGWKASTGRYYSSYKSAKRAERTAKVSTNAQKARDKRATRRMRGKRR